MNFWKHWAKEDKVLYSLGILTLLATIILLLVQYTNGFESLIQLKVQTNISNITTIADTFSQYLIDFNIEAENYIVHETYHAGALKLANTSSIIYLSLLVFSSLLFITAITRIQKILHFAGLMTFFIIWIYFLKIDMLGVFGYFNKTFLIATLLAYIGTAFYFHAYGTHISLWVRFVSFFIITAILGIIIVQYATISAPFIMLSHSVVIYPTILIIVFLILVGADILSFFSTIINQSSQGDKGGFNNLYKLLVVAILYLGNLIVYYLNFTGRIDFKLIYFDPFILITITTIVGIWGHRTRNKSFSTTVPFDGIGSYIYLSLAISSLASIYFCFASGNTAMERLFEEAILITHIATGLFFLIYLLVNFSKPLFRNIDFNHLSYTFDGIPFFTNRISAVMLILYLYSFNGSTFTHKWALFEAGKSSYKGVAYMLNGEEMLAKEEFSQVADYNAGNPVASYIMSNYAYQDRNFDKCEEYLSQVIEKNPREFAYIRISNLYHYKGNTELAIKTLNEGLKKFPKSSHLHNNLAVRYEEINKIDSSALHYTLATISEHKGSPIAISNMLALCITNNYYDIVDTLLKNDFPKSIAYTTNKIAALNYFNKKGKSNINQTFISDSILSPVQMSYLHNYSIRNLNNIPNQILKKIDEISKKEQLNTTNTDYLKAITYAYSGDRWESQFIFNSLSHSDNPEIQNYYSRTFGLIALRNKNYSLAQQTLLKSKKTQVYYAFDDAPLAYAIASFSNGDTIAFKSTLEQITQTDSTHKTLAKELLATIDASISDYLLMNDIQKVYYLLSHPDSDIFLLKGIITPNYKNFILNKLIIQSLKNNKPNQANKYWDIVQDKNNPSIMQARLRLLLYQKKYGTVISLSKNTNYLLERALAFQQSGKILEAKTIYDKGLKEQPLNNKLLISASDFYAYQLHDDLTSYDIILKPASVDQYNIGIKKTYVKRCLEQNLLEFADSIMDDLEKMMGEKEFNNFALQVKLDVADYNATLNQQSEDDFITQ